MHSYTIVYNYAMNIKIKGTGIKLTPAISDYIEDRIASSMKLINSRETAKIYVEVEKISAHHQKGEVFRTEMNVSLGKMSFRTESVASDLYASIDEAKEDLSREIRSKKGKRESKYMKGARKIKNIIKRVSK